MTVSFPGTGVTMNVCYMCQKQFTLSKNLYAHLRTVHKLKSNEIGRLNSIKCPKDDCSFSCNFIRDLRLHVQKQHNVAMVRESMVFQLWDDFLQWKTKEEKETRSSFVKHGGSRYARDGTERIRLLCHRSGRIRCTSEGLRMPKAKGSNKLGTYCTAAIDVTINKSGICVVYFKTHFGHEQDIDYLRLSRSDREAIAAKIASGMTFESILEEVRGSIQNGAVERLHLLTRKDLHNIKRDFGLDDPYLFLQDEEPSGCENESSSTTKQKEINLEEAACNILSPINKQDNEQISAVKARQLHGKIQDLASQVRLGKLSVETMSKMEKGVEHLLSLSKSDLSNKVPKCANSVKVKVQQTSFNQNICPKIIGKELASSEKSKIVGVLKQPVQQTSFNQNICPKIIGKELASSEKSKIVGVLWQPVQQISFNQNICPEIIVKELASPEKSKIVGVLKQPVQQISFNQNICPNIIVKELASSENSKIADVLRHPVIEMFSAHAMFDHTYSKM